MLWIAKGSFAMSEFGFPSLELSDGAFCLMYGSPNIKGNASAGGNRKRKRKRSIFRRFLRLKASGETSWSWGVAVPFEEQSSLPLSVPEAVIEASISSPGLKLAVCLVVPAEAICKREVSSSMLMSVLKLVLMISVKKQITPKKVCELYVSSCTATCQTEISLRHRQRVEKRVEKKVEATSFATEHGTYGNSKLRIRDTAIMIYP
jgi:hypothetical protein